MSAVRNPSHPECSGEGCRHISCLLIKLNESMKCMNNSVKQAVLEITTINKEMRKEVERLNKLIEKKKKVN